MRGGALSLFLERERFLCAVPGLGIDFLVALFLSWRFGTGGWDGLVGGAVQVSDNMNTDLCKIIKKQDSYLISTGYLNLRMALGHHAHICM